MEKRLKFTITAVLSRISISYKCQVYEIISFPCAKVCNACLAIEMHNTLEKQNDIHRDTIDLRLSLEASLVWGLLCLMIARALLQSFAGGGRALQTLAYKEDVYY
jgi:hypothetical protein